ncbi:Protein of uncharacterised function (DUF3618) [Corynebacterium kutscheri]|uniref:Protein of uncharacterized function (DUF3618) n=1 Tax=Corynebacterium kutscheri TaxID=35755 RepID=A0A0F6QYZ6_9CORY|nr:DUF3618 domain-containing protein [Corynebacterium kutscheri]AKE40847.1 Protein of unknown function (DUF3618) [Corynebacterium kutscheri]VEH06576.1 Protein of uncharacterised function (DUF3618) [Corynebacterium kutscheri]VEH09144.1 Protein of uncharacterised function (DUF3618) [Corynebacterium kutscheri]VEH82506.1 Protein of uncharacterised function (DUF3618) [Corynebacterium kutscheri]
MARNIDDIQRDIERTRRQLAGTLDEIVERSKPEVIMEDARASITSKLREPQVQKVLAGVGLVVAGVVAIGFARSRRRSKELKEIQKFLAQR